MNATAAAHRCPVGSLNATSRETAGHRTTPVAADDFQITEPGAGRATPPPANSPHLPWGEREISSTAEDLAHSAEIDDAGPGPLRRSMRAIPATWTARRHNRGRYLAIPGTGPAQNADPIMLELIPFRACRGSNRLCPKAIQDTGEPLRHADPHTIHRVPTAYHVETNAQSRTGNSTRTNSNFELWIREFASAIGVGTWPPTRRRC